ITWLASQEERMLDDHLLSLGRRSAVERAAYLIAFLHQRAASVGLDGTRLLHIPITQLHVADTLGLSIVHTNKTLRKLADRKLIRWLDRACEVLNVDGLMELAEWDGLPERKRPLI
ncbi:MAG: Crp/Fnr family transcriptional regulator, partial [Cypionkella sp.]